MLMMKEYREPPEAEYTIKAGTGKAFKCYLGQFVTVTVVKGHQIGALFAFNVHDLREFLSPPNTHFACEVQVPPLGARFLSNRRRSMFALVRDTVKRHDMLAARV